MYPQEIIIYQTGLLGKQTFQELNEEHKRKWNQLGLLGHYLRFQYFIDKDGILSQGKMDTEKGMKRSAICICVAGNPSLVQLKTLEESIEKLKMRYNIPDSKISCQWGIDLGVLPISNLKKWLRHYKGELTIIERIQDKIKEIFRNK